MKTLSIGQIEGERSVFTLPLEAVTQTFAVIAKRGVGKTHTVVVMAEEMLSNNLQVVVIDPLDVWYGLRSGADGKSAGLPIAVIGGEHGDIPLTAGAGAVLADFIVENSLSAVLVTRHLSKTEQRQFVADFCERLYFRKGEGKHRTPLHLILDEADEFCPQRLFHGSERMFGAVDTIVRRGRASGIGVTLISQRSAAINKDCLTQAEVLIALRTISPQDRKAVEAWIEAHDADNQSHKFMVSLASLPVGTAWVWSPGWLDVFQRVKIRPRRTFDSSATPKIGSKPIEPKTLADVDIESLKTRLQATIEQKKSDDPKALRKRIAELERALSTQAPAPPKIIEVQRVPQEFIAALRPVKDSIDKLLQLADRVNNNREQTVRPLLTAAPRQSPVNPVEFTRRESGLSKCERAILTVLAQYPEGRRKNQCGVIAGYSVNSGGFNNALSSLRTSGFISGVSDRLTITVSGLGALGDYTPLPTGRALAEHWMSQLPKCEREILRVLMDAHPGSMTKEQLGEQTGYSTNSGGFNNALSHLRTLELIEGYGGEIKASGNLF